MASDITEAVVEALGEFLTTEVTSLVKYVKGFPEANIDMEYPSISITALNQLFFKDPSPTEVSRGSESGNEAPIKTQIGYYEIPLQLDLWTKYRAQRNDIGLEVFNALNKNGEDQNLSLQLTDYHNEFANYTFTGMNDKNDEAGSQQKEWRRRYDIIVDVAAILERNRYLIKTSEVQDEIGFDVTVEE